MTTPILDLFAQLQHSVDRAREARRQENTRRWHTIQGGIRHDDIDPPDTKRITLTGFTADGQRVVERFVLDPTAANDPLLMRYVLDKMTARLEGEGIQ